MHGSLSVKNERWVYCRLQKTSAVCSTFLWQKKSILCWGTAWICSLMTMCSAYSSCRQQKIFGGRNFRRLVWLWKFLLYGSVATMPRQLSNKLPEYGQMVKVLLTMWSSTKMTCQDNCDYSTVSLGVTNLWLVHDLHVHLHKLVTHLHSLCGWGSLLDKLWREDGGKGREEGRRKGREGCGPLNNKFITEECSCLL